MNNDERSVWAACVRLPAHNRLPSRLYAAPASQTFTRRNLSAPQVHVNATDNGTFIDVYGSGDVYDFDQLAALTAGRSAVRRIGLYGGALLGRSLPWLLQRTAAPPLVPSVEPRKVRWLSLFWFESLKQLLLPRLSRVI